MDTYRAFLAVIISFAILLGYQYFFVGFGSKEKPAVTQTETVTSKAVSQPQQKMDSEVATAQGRSALAGMKPAVQHPGARDITVETSLYTAVITENGGAIKSFVLKKYKETNKANSPGEQLVNTEASLGYPLQFSWGDAVDQNLLYKSNTDTVTVHGGKKELTMVAQAGNGLSVTRTYSFDADNYLIDLKITVENQSGTLLQGTPRISQIDQVSGEQSGLASHYMFRGPEAFINNKLEEIKAKEYKEQPKTLQGDISWAGYGDNYFLRGIVPLEGAAGSFSMSGNESLTRTMLSGKLDTLKAGAEKVYHYKIFYGPKKIDLLKTLGYHLQKCVNFGWFDVLARPVLWLLNFLYGYIHNYGVAIILVTVMFKALFWPITQKGMKSMKNMQKLQPKMVKIKEKYKSDPTRMNQEVMNLYKTYRVNPLGGCLPMLLQVPVFFALYRVLLVSIELRHAPFMLWINDLSAPDRLWVGLHIPYLGGIPVLTLMMGVSMFFQQKLTPTTADPTQAKIMMFLPVVFTFMFLNFASGLVLYWFVNNLLSILQQVMINRERGQTAA